MSKKYLLIILLFALPLVYSWRWETHQSLVDAVYYSLPLEIQDKLNLTTMQEGSIAPDKDFHDNVLHHYPPSYDLTLLWLNESETAYENENYNEASYAFGVAAHYISDSFVAPHYIKKESQQLHSSFEKQAIYQLKSKCKNYNYNLNESLSEASQNKNDWQLWLKDKNSIIPKREAESSLKLLYPVAIKTFNAKCILGSTKLIENKFNVSITQIILILILIALISYFIIKKPQHKNP